MKAYIDIQPEVQDALAASRPVVALESTVIAHGLPYPDNLKTAEMMEKTVRQNGAVPATMGLLDGRIVVGLSDPQIERMAKDKHVAKVSRADFGPVLASKQTGATTVAATMIVSAAVGIRFFATGGIGGVHRGAQSTFDISADLYDLSRTPVAVICAGPKAVLDIGLTLEVLETLGVPVIGYGTTQLPAFYYPDSGYSLNFSCSTPQEMARVAHTQWNLTLRSGLLITNPPPPKSAMNREKTESIIEEALRAAEMIGVRGKTVTPFLLSQVLALSNGKTLKANIALLKSNAKLAAQIAVEYAKL
jgi:pseudouridine-5'-phosphate glycosidase